jgi:DNA-binding ferritin-like protein
MRLVESLLEESGISQKVYRLIELQTQLRVFHWGTFSHAQHEAFGKTYDSLNDLIDDFVEAFQGVYGRISFDGVSISLLDLEESPVEDFLKLHSDSLKSMEDDIPDTNLLNIRDEMLQEINTLLYLLTLS